ncbi:hypothetical protein C1881_03615 [Slackia isoflavoniconvertens]|uniref:Uncharacterized protein n=1 Tax=Slackia isoflavoniconvertens TaxID=572010 RepID=A0A369LM84_9ACTN|nr:hypothetical protein C1881_03615 [Slackia isoflavoniconvertens]
MSISIDKFLTQLAKRHTTKDGGMALNGKAPHYFAEATAASASAIILSMRAVAEQPPPQCPEHEPHISFSPHMPFLIIRRTDRHTQTIKIASTTAVAIFITITASFQLGAHARHAFIHQVLYRFLPHTRS